MRNLLIALCFLAPGIQAEPMSPLVFANLRTPKATYTLWAFNSFKPACPKFYLVSVVYLGVPRLETRKLLSCSGVITMAEVSNQLVITVPADDLTLTTFTYSYVYNLKTRRWVDKQVTR